MRSFAVLAVATLLVCPTLPAFADNDPPPGDNIELTLMVTHVRDNGREGDTRSYRMLAGSDSRAMLNTGWRVPIPTTSFNTAQQAGGAVMPITSFTYQNIGLDSDIEVRQLEDGRIHLQGRVEISALDGDLVEGRPKVGTFSHRFELVASPGKPHLVSMVPKPEGGSLALKLEARPVD